MTPPILFISDLHLDEEHPEQISQFVDFLADYSNRFTTLVILGDLFETWAGDDLVNAQQHRVIDAIKAESDLGTPVYFMHGNRDFLVGQQFAEATGCTLLDDPTTVSLGGKPALLMHGDLLCTDDVDYLALREYVRDEERIKNFLTQSAEERWAFINSLRTQSKQATQSKSSEIMDVNQQQVLETMTKYSVNTLIHGHTHRPAIHKLTINDDDAQRIVLGSWDSGKPSYLLWEGEAFIHSDLM